MKEQFIIAIEKNYNIKIKEYHKAARQFVAKTYILKDSNETKYFCKLINKPFFIPSIIKSLPTSHEIYKNGIKNICYPIKSKHNFYIFVDDTLVVLFNYIDAKQSYDYSLHTFGKLIAQIHIITPRIKTLPPKESFEFENINLFEKYFEKALSSSSIDFITCELQKVLYIHKAEIRNYLSIFLNICELCKTKKHKLYITHGDAPGNVLVKSFKDIFIIDWDEIMLSTIERDTWMVDHDKDFIEGYKSIAHYSTDKTIRQFFIYKYYFQGIIAYFMEIFSKADDNYKLKQIKSLENNLLNGWINPKLKGTK